MFLNTSALHRYTDLSTSSVYRALRGDRVSLKVQGAIVAGLRKAADELGFDPPTKVRFGWAADAHDEEADAIEAAQ